MKTLHENYKRRFTEAREIASSYGLPIDDFDKAISEIEDFRVTVPIIGSFSTGKSSLINAVIGQKLLSTDITPETAIPAELYYGNDKVTYLKADNTTKEGTISSLNTADVDSKNTKLITISLDNEFLSRIPSVKIVDMPGLESNNESHNKAIDNYIPQSLAYVIAVVVNDGTIPESVLRFLDELKLSNRLVYLVLTKADTVFDKTEIESSLEHIKATICKRMGFSDLTVAITSAKKEKYGTEDFKKILLELQEKSDEIFEITYSQKLLVQLNMIRSFLKNQLSVKNYDSIKLEEQKKLAESKIIEIESEIEKEKKRFREYSQGCVDSIQQRVESDLNNQSTMLINKLAHNNDISGIVNSIVRNSITSEINNNFESKLQRYAENIQKLISVDMNCFSNCQISLSNEDIEQSQKIAEAIDMVSLPLASTVAKAATDAAVTGLGSVAGKSALAKGIVSFLKGTGASAATGAASSAVLGPVGIILSTIFSAFCMSGLKSSDENKKWEMAREKVMNVIESVKSDIAPKIRDTINEIIDNANSEIDASKEQQILIQRSSIAALDEQLKKSEQDRQANLDRINRDLKRLDELEAGKEVLI